MNDSANADSTTLGDDRISLPFKVEILDRCVEFANCLNSTLNFFTFLHHFLCLFYSGIRLFRIDVLFVLFFVCISCTLHVSFQTGTKERLETSPLIDKYVVNLISCESFKANRPILFRRWQRAAQPGIHFLDVGKRNGVCKK